MPTNKVRLVQVLTRQKTGERIPQLPRQYSSTMIQDKYRRHTKWLTFGKDIGKFFNDFILFKNVASKPLNIPLERQNEIRDNLRQSIPVGRTLGRFIDNSDIIPYITELKTKLTHDFTFPEMGTEEHTQLIILINNIRTLIGNEIYARVNIPTIPERTTRVPTTTRLDIGEGNRNKSRRKGKNKRKSKGKSKKKSKDYYK